MNKNIITSENGKRQINLLAEILKYGIDWNSGLETTISGINSYRIGGLETTAFIFSCCAVQWFGLDTGIGASDVMESLKLDNLTEMKNSPTVEMLEKRITEFFLSIDE